MVYLGEGCLGVGWSFDAIYLGEGTLMERMLPEAMAMGQERPSWHLWQSRVSTAGGKERAAGETAACQSSSTRLQDFVLCLDGCPSWGEQYFH